MRGEDVQQHAMYSYLSPEQRVPANHPLRSIRQITDRILKEMSGVFARMYARLGRPSIPPEKLLRALLLQILYSLRSERMLVEEIFGRMKTVGGMRKLRHRGLKLADWMFTLAAAAYNLVRIRNLATAIPHGSV